jgi:hypothetical protein
LLRVRLEKSRSRTGKHAARALALLVSPEGRVVEPRPRMTSPVKPLYRRGEAYEAYYQVPEGWFLVYVWLVRNLRGHVKGYIEVYDSEGRMVYRAVYRRLKLRRSSGDPSYAWIVRRVADYLKLPVKNTNLGDEKQRRQPC